MAHTLGNKQRIPVTADTTSTSNPQAANVTLDAGTTVLVVCLLYAGSADRTGGNPTYNGVSLTISGATRRGTTSPECTTELWYMLRPPTGQALSLSVPNSGGLAMSIDVSWFLAGAGFGTILDAEGGANKATGTNPTHSVTSLTANDLLIGTIANGANSWAPSAQSGTAIFNNDNGTWGGGSQYILDCGTTGSETSSWTFGTSEDHGIQVALFRTITWKTANISDDESSTLADATSGRYNYRASTSDDASLGLSDDFSANLISAGGNVYDVVNWKVYGVGTPSDALSVDDSGLSARLVYLPQVSDSTVGTDQASGLFKYFASASENASGTDLVSGLLKYFASASDDATGGDGLIGLIRHLAPLSDSLSLTDSTSALQRSLALASDLALFDDSTLALFKFFASASDNTAGSDSVIGLNRFLASLTPDSFAPSDNTTALLRQLAVLTENFNSILADVVVHSLIEVGGATPINASFAEDASSGLSDSLTALHRLLALASESLTLSDLTAALQRYLFIASDDGATISDNVVAIERALANIADVFSASDSAASILDVVGQAQAILASMADSLDLSDEAISFLKTLGPILSYRKQPQSVPGVIFPETSVRRIRAGSNTIHGHSTPVPPKGVND